MTPTSVIGISAVAGDGTVMLNWSTVSAANSYNIYLSTTAELPGTLRASVTAPVTSYLDTGLTNGTPYYYIVTAINSAGESAPSAQVSATPTASGTAKVSGT